MLVKEFLEQVILLMKYVVALLPLLLELLPEEELPL